MEWCFSNRTTISKLSIRILKNLRLNLEDSDGPITPKERFALIFLLLSGLVLGLMFVMFFFIFATTYEFSEFSIEFEGMGG